MTYDDDLRDRAERGTPRGAAAVWAAAHSTSGGRGRARSLAASLALLAALGVGVWIAVGDDPAEPNVHTDAAEPDASSTSTSPTSTTASTRPTADTARCSIAVLNAAGRVGIATMAVEQFATTIGDTPIAAYNAERMELAHTAVLLPDPATCTDPLVPTDVVDPTLHPWPDDLTALVPEVLREGAVIVLLGEDWASEGTAERVVIPNVIGLPVDEAIATLGQSGFEVPGVVGDPTLPVLATNPASGLLAEVGSQVVLTTELQ